MNEQVQELLSIRPPGKPLIIGHRGLAWSYPENTRPSFEAAIAGKADMVELDFRPTVDGHLVCIHDATLKRYLDPVLHPDLQSRPVASYLLEELLRLDLATWKHPQFAGVTVPTLDEILGSYSRQCVLLLERKDGTPEQTLELLQRHDALERVIVQSFDWQYLSDLHRLAPTLALVALGGGMFTGQIDALRDTGASALHWNDLLSAADVAMLHDAEFPVWVYTLNSELAWRGAAAMGIDGITTDRCDTARTVVG